MKPYNPKARAGNLAHRFIDGFDGRPDTEAELAIIRHDEGLAAERETRKWLNWWLKDIKTRRQPRQRYSRHS